MLTVSPVVCGGYVVLKQADLCCNTESDTKCSKDQTTNKPSGSSEKNSSCMACCSVQNCHCNCIAIPEFNFCNEISIDSNRPPVKNDKVLSDYFSDCWQPPEFN